MMTTQRFDLASQIKVMGADSLLPPVKLTPRQIVALDCLAITIESTAALVGYEIVGSVKCRGRGYPAVGAGVLSSLRKLGFVDHMPEFRTWCITTSGRAALAKASAGAQS